MQHVFWKQLNKHYIFGKNILRCDNNILFIIWLSLKVSQKAKKENIIDCDFENVSNSYRLSHSWENDSTLQFSQQRIIYFNASKPNIATLPCYDYNIMLFQNLSPEYLSTNSRFTNSPMECQAYCQGERYCRFLPLRLTLINVGFLLI